MIAIRPPNKLMDVTSSLSKNKAVKLKQVQYICPKNLLSSRQCKLTGKVLKSGNFSQWRWYEIFTKGDLQFPKPFHIVKVKNMKHFVSPTSNLALKMVVPLASLEDYSCLILNKICRWYVVKLNPEFSS